MVLTTHRTTQSPRVCAWLTSIAPTEADELRLARLGTIPEDNLTLALSVFWGQASALVAFFITGSAWPIWWLIADLLLSIRKWRLQTATGAAGFSISGKDTSYLLTYALWFLTTGLGILLSISTGDLRLIVLGTMNAFGFSGYVASRYCAVPRFGAVIIYILAASLGIGMWSSNIRELMLIAFLAPVVGTSWHMLMRLNSQTLVASLNAQHENRRLSLTDPLTGLSNRLHLVERASAMLPENAPQADSNQFAVLCLDLDGFKQVNDTLGHSSGDELLKGVSSRIAKFIRHQDTGCRLGGDEFVVLLNGVGRDKANEVGERLLSALSQPYILNNGIEASVGVSIGVSCSPEDGTCLDDLLKAADVALYEAKRAGKGRLKVAG